MLEKARIRRAMLRLDQSGPFTARDVAQETSAAISTVRKNLDRDFHAGWIATEPETRSLTSGRPENLYRMTPRGRKQVNQEVDRAYRALSVSDADAEPEDEPATLSAGRQTLTSLKDVSLDRSAFLRRLRLAQAEFSEAALVAAGPTRTMAERLGILVQSAIEAVKSVPDHDQSKRQAIRDHVLRQLNDIERARLDTRLDGLIKELRNWRILGRFYIDRILGQISSLVHVALPERRIDIEQGPRSLEQPDWHSVQVNRSIQFTPVDIDVIYTPLELPQDVFNDLPVAAA